MIAALTSTSSAWAGSPEAGNNVASATQPINAHVKPSSPMRMKGLMPRCGELRAHQLDEVPLFVEPRHLQPCTPAAFQPLRCFRQFLFGDAAFHGEQAAVPCNQCAAVTNEVGERPDGTRQHRVETISRTVILGAGLHDLDVGEPECVAHVLQEPALLASGLDQGEMHAAARRSRGVCPETRAAADVRDARAAQPGSTVRLSRMCFGDLLRPFTDRRQVHALAPLVEQVEVGNQLAGLRLVEFEPEGAGPVEECGHRARIPCRASRRGTSARIRSAPGRPRWKSQPASIGFRLSSELRSMRLLYGSTPANFGSLVRRPSCTVCLPLRTCARSSAARCLSS